MSIRPIRPLRLLAAATIGLCLAGAAPARHDLRVMTFNVRYPNPDDGANRWAERRAVFVATVRAADPDVIGTQELFQAQGDDIVRALPRFRWFGRDRFGGHADEHMGIVYRSDRLRLLRQGRFWLSPTPSRPGSLGWGATLPRMANWGVFETRAIPRWRFLLLDTHLANRDREDEAARQRSAELIARRLPVLAHGLPIVMTADLNAGPDSVAYRRLTARLTDVWERAGLRSGPAGTFHDFTGVSGDRIDYVLVRGLRPVSARVLTDHDGARYPSDHFPIVADLDRSAR